MCVAMVWVCEDGWAECRRGWGVTDEEEDPWMADVEVVEVRFVSFLIRCWKCRASGCGECRAGFCWVGAELLGGDYEGQEQFCVLLGT